MLGFAVTLRNLPFLRIVNSNSQILLLLISEIDGYAAVEDPSFLLRGLKHGQSLGTRVLTDVTFMYVFY